MRTAIILSGTAYNFRYSIKSLMDNLVLPNNADVFILTSEYNMERRTKAGEIPLASNPGEWHEKSTQIERNETIITQADIDFIRSVFGDRLKVLQFIHNIPDYEPFLERDRVAMMNTVNDYRSLNSPQPFGSKVNNTENGNVKCVVDQYHHIQKCYELMEGYENQSGIRYDYVMRARIDFVCPFVFKMSHYYLNNDYPYLYLCGSYKIDPFEWTDEYCFFAKRQVADKLFKNFNRMGFITDKMGLETIKDNNEFLFAPETQFSLLIHELELKVLNVKIYRSGMYTNGGQFDYMNYVFSRNTIDVEYEYELVCRGPSDINEHLPILRGYASKCSHVTELGTRFGNSTVAFMAAKPQRFVTYDVCPNEKLEYLQLIAEHSGINYVCKIENPQTIEETDLLFIDTDHHVEQCSKELALHACIVSKYIIFHDVVSFWEKGQGHEVGGGLRYAIVPFMANHPEWKQVYRAENNNGLLILERC